jgi:hypothetical protein
LQQQSWPIFFNKPMPTVMAVLILTNSVAFSDKVLEVVLAMAVVLAMVLVLVLVMVVVQDTNHQHLIVVV